MLVLLFALAALARLSDATLVDTCGSVYQSAVSSGGDGCVALHTLSICVSNALADDATLTTQGYNLLGDSLAANLNCNLSAVPFVTYFREVNGEFVFEADASKTLKVNRFLRNATDFQVLEQRTEAVEGWNAASLAGVSIDSSINVSAIQQKAMLDITSQIAATTFEAANARVAALEGVLPSFQRALSVNLPSLVTSLKNDISQRISNQANLRATVSSNVNSLLNQVSTSISTSLSTTLIAHSSLRASFSTNRVRVYGDGSTAITTALTLESSRLAYEATIVAGQSTTLSSLASSRTWTNITTEAPRADSVCASLLAARVAALIPQSSTNDGLNCLSSQNGRIYFSIPKQKFFICNGTYWTPVILGGFSESTILVGAAYVVPMVNVVGWRWTLCYRGTNELWSNWAFKDNCGHNGPTLVVCKYGSRVFGAYTEISWDNHQIYVASPKAFLFRYDPSTGWLNQAFSTGSQYGILQYHPFTSNNGPYYGQGDFYVSGQTAYFNQPGYYTVTNSSQAPYTNTWMSGSTAVTLTEMEAYIRL